ncbi:hypothetical protein J1605_001370 [Eschrichtius robustus]|uniref:DNA-repair protein Xrcc1 N-terminal domain-containing protein n=1 Tax=Eschrichtius robustus TaxID=9764 RepID=A0AB34I5M2_ESCRO|nr:hypothetical protein J1605_001370 [Eschrichtius robustus]
MRVTSPPSKVISASSLKVHFQEISIILDPKYPVENLLNPASQRRPWLSCPQDKSGQLKVELQVERAVPIGYIDVGNCGRAFPQIDVGRSSWSLDRPFVTLLPAAMLMSLADSKQGKNCSGNRMFKDDDFLAPASGESWDQLHLTCSQPFTHHQSFGLAFLWVCSSLDTLDDPVVGPSAPVSLGLSQGSSDAQKSGPNPWLANPSTWRTFFPDPQTYVAARMEISLPLLNATDLGEQNGVCVLNEAKYSLFPCRTTKEISELRNILKQLQTGTSGCSACMVLSAAPKAPPARVVSPKHNHAEPGPGHRDSTGEAP